MPQAPLQALEIQAKSLRFIADRLGEISAALSAPPSRDTFPVFLEQANRLALMLDLVMGRTPADAPHPLEYRDVFGWDFGVFAADWDAFTKPGGTGFSFYEHDWISAGEAATQTPEVRMGAWIELLKIDPKSLKLAIDHFASECAVGELVFSLSAERCDPEMRAFRLAEAYADRSIAWVSAWKPALERLPDGPVKAYLGAVVEFASNWKRVLSAYALMQSV